ncbi:ribonuclease HI [Candidatus Saccharibacteria bacterium]|nr:ribonuclease HI [Candidatus Saccharibacteria bacterium]
MIKLFTDGSADPNPGPGGYAVVCNGEPVALGREAASTNIRMEGFALIAAYRYISSQAAASQSPVEAEIITDSEFWVNVLTKWAPSWQRAGWRKKSGQIANLELVKELYALYCDAPNVKLSWTRAHVGTDGNELADSWANQARTGVTLETYRRQAL